MGVNISENFPLLICLPVVIIGVFLFNTLFNFILSFKLKKIFPQKASKLKKDFTKPIKKIQLILVRFGDEDIYGENDPHSIPSKLYVYNDMLIIECCGRAAIINDFNLISIKENKTYEYFFSKTIEKIREDLMIYIPSKYNLQFRFSYERDLVFIKNYIEEKKSCHKPQ